MKAGYQNKPDPMRELADKMMSSYPHNQMKKGGKVKKMDKKADCYAMGGVGKIRHKEATKSGKPITLPKTCRAGKGI